MTITDERIKCDRCWRWEPLHTCDTTRWHVSRHRLDADLCLSCRLEVRRRRGWVTTGLWVLGVAVVAVWAMWGMVGVPR